MKTAGMGIGKWAAVLRSMIPLLVTLSGIALADVPAIEHGGHPRFFIGTYQYPGDTSVAGQRGQNSKDHAAEMGAAGFNCWWRYATDGSGCDTPATAKAECEAAQKYDMDVILYPSAWFAYTSYHTDYVGNPFKAVIDELRDETGFLGWYTFDEAYWVNIMNPGSLPYASVQSAYNYVKSPGHDPDHPVFYCEAGYYWLLQNGATDQKVRDYIGIGDACALDGYPCSSSIPYPQHDLYDLARNLDKIRDCSNGLKPLWIVLQGFSDEWRAVPTLTEQRFMAYDNMIHGVKGLMWWGLHTWQPDSVGWKTIKKVVGEIRDYQDVWVSDGTTSGISLSSPDLEAKLFTYNGYHYLIVANKRWAYSNSKWTGLPVNNATITVSGWQPGNNGNKVPVLFEKRTIASATNSWTDSFDAWGVHIYTDAPQYDQGPYNDFDGDGKTDYAVFFPGSGWWRLKYSTNGYGEWIDGGCGADCIALPGDFNGDGRTDLGSYNPTTGVFTFKDIVTRNMLSSISWDAGQTPISGDWDGDFKTDVGVFSPATGQWHIRFSSTGLGRWITCGDPNACLPVTGDYDGDGKSDIAVFYNGGLNAGQWTILRSTTDFDPTRAWRRIWGSAGDVPITGDFDGDGISDLAVYRLGNSQSTERRILRSRTGCPNMSVFANWGDASQGDICIMGDYDGDKRTDLSYFRPSGYSWTTLKSNSNFLDSLVDTWGDTGCVPGCNASLSQSAGSIGQPARQTTLPQPIGQVRGMASGSSVQIEGVVTALFDDCAYVEDPRRCSAIRVEPVSDFTQDAENGQNLAPAAQASAQSWFSLYPPRNATDGNLTTKWYGSTQRQWFRLDWSTPQSINSVKIYNYEATWNQISDAIIEAWDSAQGRFIQVAHGALYGTTTYTFPAVYTTALRVSPATVFWEVEVTMSKSKETFVDRFVTVTGSMTTRGNEPMILAQKTIPGLPATIAPAGLSGRDLKSEDGGLTVRGLLVKTWGKVTRAETVNGQYYAYVDDGSRLPTAMPGIYGVKVGPIGTSQQVNAFLEVTGIAGDETVSGLTTVTLRPRSPADVRSLQ